jgi:uncharacterized oxidoreductase
VTHGVWRPKARRPWTPAMHLSKMSRSAPGSQHPHRDGRCHAYRGPASPESFLDSAEAVVTTNVLGPIRLIAAFIEHLQARPDATIVTVSSGLAFAPLKVTPSYNASKAAIHMLTESLRLQLADTSVKLLELEPPAVRTGLLPGQEESEFAMPLDEFVTRGDYDQVVATLNPADPHGN